MKYIILVIFSLLATQFVLAQSVSFGIKGGFNEAFVDAGPLPTGTKGIFRLGFNAGAFAEFEFKKWSVEPGLFYTLKGYNVTSNFVQPTPGGDLNISIKGSQTYKYIELPVNVLYNIKIKPGKIFIGGGPYMGYLLSSVGRRNTTVNGTDTYTETHFDIGSDGDFKRMDFGANILIGIALKNRFLFNIESSNGITDILAKPPTIIGNPPLTKTKVLSASIGYSFR